MTDDELKRWEDRYRNVPVEDIQDLLRRGQFTNEQRKFLNDYLDRRRAAERAAADAPEQERFTKGYKQSERHHRQLIWCTLIAAVIGAFIGAAVTWFSYRSQANGMLQPAPLTVATPAPSPTEAPAERQ